MPKVRSTRPHNRCSRDPDPTFHIVCHNVLDEKGDDLPVETSLTCVYFVLDREAAQVKIGVTNNVGRRLGELSKQRKRPLDLLGTLDGGYDLERAMHGLFRDFRREGYEWYSTEILGEVAPLLAA